jgi:hypothetical protein
MNMISDSFRAVVWFILCVAMALSMVTFAIIYAGLKVAAKKLAWKQISFPQVRIAK